MKGTAQYTHLVVEGELAEQIHAKFGRHALWALAVRGKDLGVYDHVHELGALGLNHLQGSRSHIRTGRRIKKLIVGCCRAV